MNRGQIFYLTNKDFQDQDLKEILKDIGLFSKKDNEFLILRKIPKISPQEYYNMKNINIDAIIKLFHHLQSISCNFKSVSFNENVGSISPLTYLIESNYQAKKEKVKEMKNKYDILQKFIINYRTINRDGNSFYRAVMFRYLEILILTNNIEQLKNVVFDFMNSFQSEKLKSRIIIRGLNIKPDLSIKILILIIDLLSYNMVEEAHKILVKSFTTCQKFYYAMILYFRYLLYDYIRQNENKIYLKAFPVKIGNLLPYQYKTEDEKFLFNEFYEEYLLKFFTDAQKIIIYLTPFVLQIEVNVIIFDDNEKDILKRFKWEGTSELKTNEVISLLNYKNYKNHYEIFYTANDYNNYRKSFEIYENKQKSIILSHIEKYLNHDENNFKFLQSINKQKNLIKDVNESQSNQKQFKSKIKINYEDKNNNEINIEKEIKSKDKNLSNNANLNKNLDL